MLTLKEIREKLVDRRPGKVAECTGLSTVTIARIRDGRQANPTLKVMEALSKYFADNR